LVARAGAMGLSAESFGAHRVGFIEMGRRLSAVASRFPAGVIHSHGYKPDILLALAPFARRWARVSTCHTWYSDTWRMRLWEYLDKRVLRSFDGVVPVSGFLERELLESGVAPDRIALIDNGIDAPERSPADAAAIRAELGLSESDRLVVQIGRLAQSKRNDLLLEALSRLPEALSVHLAFVGDGEEKPALQALVAKLNLHKRVHFLGYRADAPRFLSAADVMAITSDHEGLPIVLLEAMAARCPIVSTRVGAIGNVLQDGVSAWLVAPGDAQSFSKALEAMLSSTSEAQRRATAAREAYEQRHSRSSMGARYKSLYQRALARHRGELTKAAG
jgi:glycosyltransferase involved in cell wall biosynthesis